MNTGMPLEGRSGIATPFTGVLSEEHQMAIEIGIPLFEIHKPKINPMGTQDFGYIDVRMHREPDGRGIIQTWAEWLRGDSAYITYYPEKRTGTCYGYIPDDQHWANRIRLASNISAGDFNITKYITENGVLQAGRITEEIRFIEQYIHDWRIVVGNETVARSKNLMEMREEAKKLVEKGTKCQVLYSKVEAIQNIIKEHKNKWIYTSEFQEGYLLELKSAIALKFEPPKPVNQNIDIRAAVIDVLSGMSSEELLLTISKAKEGKKDTTGKQVKDLSMQEARSVAKAMGINTYQMSLDQIKDAIRDKSGKKFPISDDENKGDSEEKNAEEEPEKPSAGAESVQFK